MTQRINKDPALSAAASEILAVTTSPHAVIDLTPWARVHFGSLNLRCSLPSERSSGASSTATDARTWRPLVSGL
jgi:hypothetical protein